MITQEQLDRLRELEAAVDSVAWKILESDDGFIQIRDASGFAVAIDLVLSDAQLIAESRNALPALLDEIELLREREAKLKGALEQYADGKDSQRAFIGTTDHPPETMRARLVLAELYPDEHK